jgi:hypothetical protein
MSAGLVLLRLGGLGLLLSALVFWQDPLMDFRLHHPEWIGRLTLLYGFPWVTGIALLALGPDLFILENVWRGWLLGTLCFCGLPWLLVWCFLWSRLISPNHWQALTLADGWGIGFALVLGLTGWLSAEGLKSRVWFSRGLSWVVFYESILNLFLQPSLWFLAFSACGAGLILWATFVPRRITDGL